MAEQKHVVSLITELPPGAHKIIDVEGKSIGVFNVNGEYVAVLNLCPHEFAPICLGRVGGTTLPSAPHKFIWGHEGEILACPWHGWEFNLLSGQCLTDRRRLHHFPVVVEGGVIYIVINNRKK